ncbi:MAG: DUF1080 domain-containing protein [Planctomycetes bacterium]|nr:DUF1080 domain-containing protein [Planctomycetota bacterium]
MNSPSKSILIAALIIAAPFMASPLGGCASSPRPVSLIPAVNSNIDSLWVKRGGIATFVLEDGTITGTTAPNTTNTFLCTTAEYSDFILELDFRTDPDLNSGIQIRSHHRPEIYKTQPIERVHGYQIEIDPSDRKWTGGLYDEAGRGWLADLKSNPAAQAAFKQSEWNHFRIHADGPRIRTWLNGIPVIDYTETAHIEANRSGFIALQVHGVGGRTEPLQVQWRNITLRPPSE